MSASEFPQTHVINLERSPERMEALRETFAPFDLDIVRVEAIDGQLEGERCLSAIDDATFKAVKRRPATIAEAACALSHFSIWDRFATDPDMPDTVLVLEDDSIPTAHFADLPEIIAALPENWEVLMIRNRTTWPFWRKRVAGVNVLRGFWLNWGAVAYVINRRIIRHRYRWSGDKPVAFPIDSWRFWAWRDGMHIYGCSPPLVRHNWDVESVIHSMDKGRTEHGGLGLRGYLRSEAYRTKYFPLGVLRAVRAWFNLTVSRGRKG